MGRGKKRATIDSEYIEWMLELSTAPGSLELKEAVYFDALDAAEQELERILNEIDDPYKQRRFRAAIRNALDAKEKLGFCIGHLSHERGF